MNRREFFAGSAAALALIANPELQVAEPASLPPVVDLFREFSRVVSVPLVNRLGLPGGSLKFIGEEHLPIGAISTGGFLSYTQDVFYVTTDPQDLDPAQRTYMAGRSVGELHLERILMAAGERKHMEAQFADVTKSAKNQLEIRAADKGYRLSNVVLTDVSDTIGNESFAIYNSVRFQFNELKAIC